jgi:hypothetical protein
MPTSLYRDDKPVVQSISWSPLGMAANSGYSFSSLLNHRFKFLGMDVKLFILYKMKLEI